MHLMCLLFFSSYGAVLCFDFLWIRDRYNFHNCSLGEYCNLARSSNQVLKWSKIVGVLLLFAFLCEGSGPSRWGVSLSMLHLDAYLLGRTSYAQIISPAPTQPLSSPFFVKLTLKRMKCTSPYSIWKMSKLRSTPIFLPFMALPSLLLNPNFADAILKSILPCWNLGCQALPFRKLLHLSWHNWFLLPMYSQAHHATSIFITHSCVSPHIHTHPWKSVAFLQCFIATRSHFLTSWSSVLSKWYNLSENMPCRLLLSYPR